MSGFRISKDVSKIVSFINRNCASCKRGYLQDNIAYCKQGEAKSSILAKEHEKVYLTEYCVTNAKNILPCVTCYAFKRVEEYDPFDNV